jgi:hypothetical protein
MIYIFYPLGGSRSTKIKNKTMEKVLGILQPNGETQAVLGSYALHYMLTHNYGKKLNWTPNDCDLFVSMKDEEWPKFITSCKAKLEKEGFKVTDVSRDSSKKSRVRDFTIAGIPTTLSLVRTDLSIRDTQHSFDLSCCQVKLFHNKCRSYLEDRDVFCAHALDDHIEEATVDGKCRIRTVNQKTPARCEKYIGRGFKMSYGLVPIIGGSFDYL